MKIEINDEFFYLVEDAIMVGFLKKDLETANQNLITDCHPDDVKYNKKLIKAYKRILDYYGVKDV